MPAAEREMSSDWTVGAPKWAAVIVLGVASIAALAYSVMRESRPWRTVQPVAVAAEKPGIAGSVGNAASAEAIPAMSPNVTAATDAAKGLTSPISQSKPKPAATMQRTININTASAAELELLSGIGPSLAKRIIDHRTTYGPFKRVDDLDAVKGIGPRLIERIRANASVE